MGPVNVRASCLSFASPDFLFSFLVAARGWTGPPAPSRRAEIDSPGQSIATRPGDKAPGPRTHEEFRRRGGRRWKPTFRSFLEKPIFEQLPSSASFLLLGAQFGRVATEAERGRVFHTARFEPARGVSVPTGRALLGIFPAESLQVGMSGEGPNPPGRMPSFHTARSGGPARSPCPAPTGG